MKRENSKGVLKLLLFLFAGIMIGGLIGHFLGEFVNIPILSESIRFGMSGGPVSLNLIFAELVLGINFVVNIGTIFGLILGIIFYAKA